MEIYRTVLDAEKSACCWYDSGKERTTSTGITYFHVECRLLDFNGQVFGEVSSALGMGNYKGPSELTGWRRFHSGFMGTRKK